VEASKFNLNYIALDGKDIFYTEGLWLLSFKFVQCFVLTLKLLYADIRETLLESVSIAMCARMQDFPSYIEVYITDAFRCVDAHRHGHNASYLRTVKNSLV
jgi:hypothetical protein